MKKFIIVLALGLMLAFTAGVAVAVVGYEDDGAEVGITAVGAELEEGMDVVITEVGGELEEGTVGLDGDSIPTAEGPETIILEEGPETIVVELYDGDDEKENNNLILFGGLGAVALIGGAFLILRKKN